MQSKGLKTQVLKRFCKPLITLLKEWLSLVSIRYLSHQVVALSLINLALLISLLPDLLLAKSANRVSSPVLILIPLLYHRPAGARLYAGSD
jgi:hypothetical protein